MVSVKFVVCVSDPLLPVTITVKLPVGVPVTTLKFTAPEAPPPGVGFVTTTGKLPAAAMSLAVNEIASCDALV